MGAREEKIEKIGKMIIENAASVLFTSMRYLDLAIFALTPFADKSINIMGTDGERLFYSPEGLIEEFKKDGKEINRVFLHSIFHCLYRHLFNSKKYIGDDAFFWDIACDITVERLIDDLDVSAINPIVSRYRTYIYKRVSLEMDTVTAEGVFKALKKWDDFSESDYKIMYKVFCMDDHGYWARNNGSDKTPPPTAESGGQNNNPPNNDLKGIANGDKSEKKWEDLSERTASEMEHFKKDTGDGEDGVLKSLKAVNRHRYDYGEFLKRFAVYGEEALPDENSFDYAFYTYGMELYGNMPIIEPLEYREVKKIADFAIVLDTSASCSGEAIQGFLNETFSLLKLRENFFKSINIHIIQCDSKIRRDTVVKNSNDINKYIEELNVEGFGGTDFRPAFEYVDELKAQGSLKNLKGLIYFTDGEGTFPEKPPKYDVAFVFLKEYYYDAQAPSWAVKLVLEPEQVIKHKEVI